MIFLLYVFCFVVGFVGALAAILACAAAWRLFWAALDRMGDGS